MLPNILFLGRKWPSHHTHHNNNSKHRATYDVVFFSELKGIEELFQDALSRPLAGLELGMLCNIVAAFQIISGNDFIARHIHLGKCFVD